MRTRLTGIAVILLLQWLQGSAQSIHFSQYYNAPMLVNPANTGMMADYDYRGGINYRNQWATVPVPYNTVSAFADFKVGGNVVDRENVNWLGIGGAFFNDKAGDGNLALNEFQLSAAYHLHLGNKALLSGGLSGAVVQRSVNFANLTFDAQWDGESFNTNIPNNEKNGILKTNYETVGGGLYLAWFPNDQLYAKVGGSVANINQPTESFYGGNNHIFMRPTANVDVVVKASQVFIINPSFYYATQAGAQELLFGSLCRILVGKPGESKTQLILGGYMRSGDALIGAVGFQRGGLQIMFTYDNTVSTLAPYNLGYGAAEFSLIYQGLYSGFSRPARTYNCPRFF
jgi:type IX secretion system PorP/SprF family membrane protein